MNRRQRETIHYNEEQVTAAEPEVEAIADLETAVPLLSLHGIELIMARAEVIINTRYDALQQELDDISDDAQRKLAMAKIKLMNQAETALDLSAYRTSYGWDEQDEAHRADRALTGRMIRIARREAPRADNEPHKIKS